MQILSFSKYPKLKKLLNYIIESLKISAVVKDNFKKHDIDLKEIDLIPICFVSDLDVSARTEKGIIYVNIELLKASDLDDLEECSKEINHYIVHEVDHYLDQVSGNVATKGSNDDNYLDNKSEISGFREQSKFITETQGPQKAEKYIEQVIDHHDLEGKERKEKKQDLLDTSVPEKTASKKSHEPNYENAEDPLFTFHRRRHDKLKLNDQERQDRIEKLRKLLEATEIKKSAKLRNLSKTAGIFQPPPKLLEAITNWCLARYASKVWGLYKLAGDKKNDLILFTEQEKKIYNQDPKQKVENLISNIIKDINLLKPIQFYDNKFTDFDLNLLNYKNLNWYIDISYKPKKQMFNIRFGNISKSLNKKQLIEFLNNFVKPELTKKFEQIRSFYNSNEPEEMIRSNTDFKVFNEIIDLCKIYTDKPNANAIINSTSFKIKDLLQDWKYIKNEIEYDEEIKCEFYLDIDFAKSKTGIENDGFWDFTNKIIGFIVPPFINYEEPDKAFHFIKKDIEYIKELVKHEVIHAGQTILEDIKKLKEPAGIPSKHIRPKDLDVAGNLYPVVFKNKNEERADFSFFKDNYEENDTMTLHALRDIEFYTRLSDSINIFNKSKTNIKDEDLYDEAKVFTDVISSRDFFKNRKYKGDLEKLINIYDTRVKDQFFVLLKKHQPEKWKKAVKEFFKAVGL